MALYSYGPVLFDTHRYGTPVQVGFENLEVFPSADVDGRAVYRTWSIYGALLWSEVRGP